MGRDEHGLSDCVVVGQSAAVGQIEHPPYRSRQLQQHHGWVRDGPISARARRRTRQGPGESPGQRKVGTHGAEDWNSERVARAAAESTATGLDQLSQDTVATAPRAPKADAPQPYP